MANLTSVVNSINSAVSSIFRGTLANIIIAFVLILVGLIVGRIAGKLLTRILNELELDRTLEKAGFKMPLEKTVGTILSYLIYSVSVIMAMNQLGLTTIALYIIIGGAVVLILIATALGIKDFIPNLIAGFFIYKKRLFRVGDIIEVDSTAGCIKEITLIETELETESGDRVHIPNSLLVKTYVKVKKR